MRVLARYAAGAALASAAALQLTACSAPAAGDRPADAPTPAVTIAPASEPVAVRDRSGSAPVDLDGPALEDPVLQHRVRPLAVIRDFPLDPDTQRAWQDRDDYEQILVQVEADASTGARGSLRCAHYSVALVMSAAGQPVRGWRGDAPATGSVSGATARLLVLV